MSDSENEHPSEGDSVKDPTIAAIQFEGVNVVDMEGKVPAFVLDMAEGYLRGTHVRLELELRVKGVNYVEGKRGEVHRQHVFSVEAVEIKSAFDPNEAVDTVGGSAAAGAALPTEGDTEELGIQFGRSSDTWGPSAVGF